MRVVARARLNATFAAGPGNAVRNRRAGDGVYKCRLPAACENTYINALQRELSN